MPAPHPARARGSSPSTYLAPPAAGGGQQRSPTAATAAPSPPRAGPGSCAHVQPGALPRLRVTILPLTVTAPGAVRASRSPRARTRGGTQRFPARPAAPRSLQPAGPASRRLPRRTPIPPHPRAGAAHWLRRLPGDEQPRPSLVGRGLSLRSAPGRRPPSASSRRSCGRRTCYARAHPAAAPRPQLSGPSSPRGHGEGPSRFRAWPPRPPDPNAPQGAKVGLPRELGGAGQNGETPTGVRN